MEYDTTLFTTIASASVSFVALTVNPEVLIVL